MTYRVNFYVLIYFVTAAVAAAQAAYVWRRWNLPGRRYLFWFMLAGVEWAVASGLEIAAVSLPTKIGWATVSYVGAAACPVLYLGFVLGYVRSRRFPLAGRLRWLWLLPVCTLALVITNRLHHLIWVGYVPSAIHEGLLVYSHGPWFFVHTIYSYSLLAVSGFLLARAALTSPQPYRGQFVALLVAAVVPLAVNAVYAISVKPLFDLDLSPFALVVTGLVLAWGIVRFGLFDLAPVARVAAFENMSDGLLVVDWQGRLADINPAAERMFKLTHRSVVGQPLAQALAGWPGPAAAICREVAAQVSPDRPTAEICLGDPPSCVCQLKVLSLTERTGARVGQLVELHDITAAKVAEEALQKSNAELQARNQELDAFAHTVAHDLKGQLTVIGGYAEIAADFAESTTVPAELHEYLDEVLRGTVRMSRLISGLLLLARTAPGESAVGSGRYGQFGCQCPRVLVRGDQKARCCGERARNLAACDGVWSVGG